MAPVVTRKRISYVLPLDSERDGHRLGVNGLAYDHNHSILCVESKSSLEPCLTSDEASLRAEMVSCAHGTSNLVPIVQRLQQ